MPDLDTFGNGRLGGPAGGSEGNERGAAENESRHEASEVILDKGWFTFGKAKELMLAGQISAGHTFASIALVTAFINQNPDRPIVRATR